jgi:hypothetical protein
MGAEGMYNVIEFTPSERLNGKKHNTISMYL